MEELDVHISVEAIPTDDADEPFIDLVIDAGPIHMRIPVKRDKIDKLLSDIVKGKTELES